MGGYHANPGKKARVPRRIWRLITVLVLLLIVGSTAVRYQYNRLLAPISTDQTSTVFTVEKGSTVKQIATNLESKHLIKSAWAMQLYVYSKELSSKLQAGTFALSPNQGTATIVKTLTKGKLSTQLVTILPGQRIDQIRASFINYGFEPAAVDQALDPTQYAALPVLSFKPASVNTLEGLLWPDSFQKDNTTTPTMIISQSLAAMAQHLGSDVQAAFAADGLTTYQGLVLTSIITMEVSTPSDQPQVAQVFLSRLKQGMMLGSDVTANYGAIIAGKQPDVTYDSVYNTRLHTGIPPNPISTVTANALAAATHPASTDWLYFVAGDDGTTYFSKTNAEHEALTAKYCHKLCGR